MPVLLLKGHHLASQTSELRVRRWLKLIEYLLLLLLELILLMLLRIGLIVADLKVLIDHSLV